MIDVIPLSEGVFTIDATKEFVPFNLETDKIQDRPRGSLLVEIQPFCIIFQGKPILLDTGLGFGDNNERLQIHENLRQHGIAPEDIQYVLMSHLHKDHAGGIAYKGELNFPNATYVVHEKEWQFALDKGKPSYDINDFTALHFSDQLHLLKEDAGEIMPGIRYEMPGGHCPYHLAFWIEEGEETVFFGGDVAPQLHQMKHRYVAKYDYDGKLCVEWRAKWWEQAHQENWKILFYHDIQTPVWSNRLD